MKAVLFREHGGPEKLSYEELPVPKVGPQDVLVRVKACALNHLDIWVRQGSPAYSVPFPHVGGSDVSGIVEQVGTQVEGIAIGTRVFVSPGISCWNCEFCLAGRDNMCRTYSLLGAKMHGGYAEYVKVPFRNVLPIPENVTFEQAAAFPLVSVTAWHMLFALAKLQPGETVLVMGAGSGVGMMAVQLAKLAGARVIGVTIVRIRREDELRFGAADDVDEDQLFVASSAQVAVTEIELLAEGGSEDFRGARGFTLACLRRATRAHLATGEVDHADAQTILHRLHDRGAATELDVVRMRTKKEQINFLHLNTHDFADIRIGNDFFD